MMDERKVFWSVEPSSLLAELSTTPKGLSSAEAAARLKQYGPNLSQTRRDVSALSLLLHQFESPLVLLLLFAMVLSFFLGETTDAVIILGIVLASSGLGFWQEYRAANAVADLLRIIQTKVAVLRDGNEVEIPAEDIVPGDVILLSAGGAIPADALILESKDLYVDEAALTGESYPAEKATGAGVLPVDTPLSRRSNTLFQGTHVVSGTAKAVVVLTGSSTQFGQISERLQLRPPETEFESGLRKFGDLLIKITLILVIAIFAINVFFQRPVLESFLFALALAVGLTPELLPAIVSVTLASGARRMAREQVIVKRLNAIENFGSMNVLCSDKTGTLTEGVVKLHAALDPNGHESERVLLYASLNATYESGFTNPIDEAIRGLRRFDLTGYTKVDEVPYDFVRKRLSVVVEQADPSKPHQHLMITKGALRHVLDVCSSVEFDGSAAGGDGGVSMDKAREPILDCYEQFSNQGYRVLGVAYRDVTGDPIINKDDETDMTFLGFLLFEDPPKSAIGETLDELKQLGVRLKIITGDNRLVTRHIGQQVGLSNPDILTGPDLRQMSDEALRSRANDVDLFAEVEPNQKERILIALRKAGNVVGYIGDGINDASALHAADVGISVDSAVDVAKEAADIVLLKHDLKVLTQGVRDGRKTFANTLKYVYITTSANFGNMFSMAGASLFLPYLPLLPKQILLNNFLSDLPALTIASDNVDPEQIAQPRRWDIRLIRNFMIVFGLVSSIFDFMTFGALLFILHAGPAEFRTGWFIESLLTELFVLLVMRTHRMFFKSKPSLLLLISTLLVALVAVLLPYSPLAAPFGFVPLPIPFMMLLLGITALYVLGTEITKRVFFRTR